MVRFAEARSFFSTNKSGTNATKINAEYPYVGQATDKSNPDKTTSNKLFFILIEYDSFKKIRNELPC